MTRDRKITILSVFVLLLITIGHELLNLYVWIVLVLIFGFILLSTLARHD